MIALRRVAAGNSRYPLALGRNAIRQLVNNAAALVNDILRMLARLSGPVQDPGESARTMSTERSPGGGEGAPVDLAHLARQTGGDRALEREVLALFIGRSAIDLDRLKAAAAGDARREAAHLMVGSARAIGAVRVSRLAAAVEEAAEGPCDLADLEAAVAEARAFVADYLAR